MFYTVLEYYIHVLQLLYLRLVKPLLTSKVIFELIVNFKSW